MVGDFIVVCRSLGFYVHEHRTFDGKAYGEEQRFCTVDGRLAFTVRAYKNGNAHMRVDRGLMMRFNIEVARLRNWINNHNDIKDEFEVSEAEAIRLWKKPSLCRIGHSDLSLPEFNGLSA